MAISQDVLYSALVDLEPGWTEQFTTWSPVFDAIIKKGNKETLESYQKEFVVTTNGPGEITGVPTGNELIARGKRNVGARGNEYPARLIYAFNVTGKELDEANGKYDLARLIADYPEMAIADFHEEIARQFVMGTGRDCGDFITLNGDDTYTPNGAARAGILDFVAPASQSDTVFGLVKSGGAGGVTGWHNQYADISSFAFNGRQVLRDTYNLASRQGAAKTFGKCDHMFADAGSYSNYLSSLDEPVRFSPPQNQKGDPAKPEIRDGIDFLDATMWLEDKIDPAGFSTAAANDGVIYGLNTSTWHMFLQGHGGITQNKGFFSVRPPFRLPDREAWAYEIVFAMGMYCKSLRSNFVVTGGATP